MTDKTPIEKAAEDVSSLSYELMKAANLPMNAKEIANIIRRRLEKEVPPRKVKITERISASDFSYNHCRRDIGLRDEEETTWLTQ